MILYIILLCLHTCHCITVTRGKLFDTAKGGVACRNKCTCRSPTATYFNLPGKEKCTGAMDTGCSLKVDGYTADVPLITQSMLNKTEFRITKDGRSLCPNTLDTFEASSVRMLALTDKWEVVPTFMSNSVLYSIPNVQEVKVMFHAVWSGLLIKLEVKCKASNGNEYTPRENCVLFKYEGTATYPLTLSTLEPKSMTTMTTTTIKTTTSTKTTPTTTPTTTTIPTQTTTSKETNTASKSNTKVTHASLETSTPVTSASTTHSKTSISSSPTTGTSKDNNDNGDIAMAAGIAATVILILVAIIIILICYKRKLDRKSSSRKVAYTKTNSEENIYDQVNKKEEDENKGESEIIEFCNTTYGNKINLYAKVGDESEEQKQDSHYYNTNDINKNSNYYNVFGEKKASHVDNKPINAMNVNEYDQIWSNNGGNGKKVESGKSDHGDDKSSRDDVDDEENAYIVTGGLSHNI